MEQATQFITQKALELIPFLYFIGMFLKWSESVKDKYIPLILLAVSIASCLIILGLNFQSVIQGVLVAGTTVFTNQLVKQFSK